MVLRIYGGGKPGKGENGRQEWLRGMKEVRQENLEFLASGW